MDKKEGPKRRALTGSNCELSRGCNKWLQAFQERVERRIKKDGELEEVLRRQIGAEGSELAAAHPPQIFPNPSFPKRGTRSQKAR